MTRKWPPVVFLPVCLLASGCGGDKVPAAGVVLFEGKPVERAIVTFIPADNNPSLPGIRQGSALTNENGEFAVVTGNSNGVYPGLYKVVISKRELPPGAPAPKDETDMIGRARAARAMRETLPALYTKESSTPLEIEIPKRGAKDLRFELKSSRKG